MIFALCFLVTLMPLAYDVVNESADKVVSTRKNHDDLRKGENGMFKKLVWFMLPFVCLLPCAIAFAGCTAAEIDATPLVCEDSNCYFLVVRDDDLNTITIKKYSLTTDEKRCTAVADLDSGIVTVTSYKADGTEDVEIIESDVTAAPDAETQTVSGSKTTRSKYAYHYKSSTSCDVACPAFAGNADAIYSFTTFEHAGNVGHFDAFRDTVNQIDADEKRLEVYVGAGTVTTLINTALAIAENPMDFGAVLKEAVAQLDVVAEAQIAAYQIGVSQDRAQVLYNRLQNDYAELLSVGNGKT